MNSSACADCVPAELLKQPKITTAVAYSVTFVIAIAGNVCVLVLLVSKVRQRRHSRLHIFLLHMCLADLIVTLVYMPQQALWSLTVYWQGSDWLCRLCHWLAVLGVYLSAAVLVCLNVDQVYAIATPLTDMSTKTNIFLGVAWTSALVASLPQLLLFEKHTHPLYPSIAQCVPVHMTYKDPHRRLLFVRLALVNTLLNALMSYILPVLTVTACQGLIIYNIQLRRQQSVNLTACGATRSRQMGGSTSESSLWRAQQRATRVTVAAVLAFIVCWTPYYVVAIVHFLGTDFRTGEVHDLFPALHITPRMREMLEWFSVFKSSVNPYLYGLFAFQLSWQPGQNLSQKYITNFVRRNAQKKSEAKRDVSTAFLQPENNKTQPDRVEAALEAEGPGDATVISVMRVTTGETACLV